MLFKDNGKGIHEKNFKNLFGLYKRFDTTIEGKGLGLFMVKMQVENLGGKINVQSEPGSGTTFKIEFPKVNFVN
jgi:signal transduction histidine kinase